MSGAQSLQRFTGKTAFITGGARGQGAAHGKRLAAEGARVILADVLDTEGEHTASELRDNNGVRVDYIHLDVSDPAEWEQARAFVEEDSGALDVLVNNAGILRVEDLTGTSLETWNRILTVNLTGAFLGMQVMHPLLVRAAHRTGQAAVVNTSSIFGPSGAKGYAAYCASKAGMLGLTRTAALEWAEAGIRVNALVPGGVSSPINEGEPGGGVIPETPLGRRAQADELAAAVAYLAGPDASFMTGAELVVDGGFRAR